MPTQTIILTAPFSKDGLTMTISLKVRDGEVLDLTGKDSRGRKFRGCFRFSEVRTKGGGKPAICCCCIDANGDMVCRPGPCRRRSDDDD